MTATDGPDYVAEQNAAAGAADAAADAADLDFPEEEVVDALAVAEALSKAPVEALSDVLDAARALIAGHALDSPYVFTSDDYPSGAVIVPGPLASRPVGEATRALEQALAAYDAARDRFAAEVEAAASTDRPPPAPGASRPVDRVAEVARAAGIADVPTDPGYVP